MKPYLYYCYQTKLQVHSLGHSKANLLTLDCGEGKRSVYCRAPSKESRLLVLQRPNSLMAFRERFLKTG